MMVFNLNNLVNTYFRTNILRFIRSDIDFKSNITELSINQFFKLDLDTNLLNEKIFGNLRRIYIYNGKLNSIHLDLFKYLNKIRTIKLSYDNFFSICHRQGIGWIKSINSHLNVNLSN